jgi:magnesium transporter
MAKSKNKIKQSSKIGLAPGSIVYIGSNIDQKTTIEVIDYNSENISNKKIENLDDCLNYIENNNITWLNATGLSDIDFIKKFGQTFDLHRLLLEDIVNTKHRPKLDEYPDFVYIILKMLYYNEENELEVEHLNLLMGKKYVFTLQEISTDVFAPLRERLNESSGKIRHRGTDYLTFAIMDSIIDHYFLIIERIGEKIIDLENKLFDGKDQDTIVREIQNLKHEVIKVRRAIFPIREVVSRFEKLGDDIVVPETQLYVRDLYDNTIQVIEAIESFRDSVNGLMDMHMNNISNNMNKVMKVLTIISTLFIPLTFIAGVYGMNFDYIPELRWHYGYLAFWILMVILITFMMVYFRRKKWF